jgi:hypothetical protein
MTGQSTSRQHGDKGRWYLEMLGVRFDDGPPTLQRVADSRQTTSTSEAVTEMWDKTEESAAIVAADDPLAHWAPTELSATVSSRRKVRWPIVIGALLVGLVAALALWWMPQESDRRLSNHADTMRAALSALHGDLIDTQTALATATEPNSAEPDLGSVAVNLAGIADSSARLLDIAGQPIPASLPLTVREPFDDLDSFRLTLGPLAAEGTTIRSEVADITDYRLALARVLDVGELPRAADSATITEQGAALARALATSVAALTEMPLDGPFAEHRTLVETRVTGFAAWQDDYLAALREGDSSKAQRLVAELTATKEQLQEEVIATLAALRTEVDGRILDLAAGLERAIQLVP